MTKDPHALKIYDSNRAATSANDRPVHHVDVTVGRQIRPASKPKSFTECLRERLGS